MVGASPPGAALNTTYVMCLSVGAKTFRRPRRRSSALLGLAVSFGPIAASQYNASQLCSR